MGYAFGSIDELGEGAGFRSVRRALGVTAFGVNAIVFPRYAEKRGGPNGGSPGAKFTRARARACS